MHGCRSCCPKHSAGGSDLKSLLSDSFPVSNRGRYQQWFIFPVHQQVPGAGITGSKCYVLWLFDRTRLLSLLHGIFMTTFKDPPGCLLGDAVAADTSWLISHISMPRIRQQPRSLGWTCYCDTLLWLIHFFGGLPAQMAPSCSFTATEKDNVLTAVNCHWEQQRLPLWPQLQVSLPADLIYRICTGSRFVPKHVKK